MRSHVLMSLALWLGSVLASGAAAGASGGRVIQWNNIGGRTDLVVSALGAGGNCAIQAGTNAVFCWGANGVPVPPPSLDGTAGTAAAISPEGFCAIQAGTGAAICWDWPGDTVPASVNGAEGTATAISGNSNFGCAIQAGTQAVVCWLSGVIDYGQAVPPPSVNGSLGGASAIAAFGTVACAIQAGTGAVVCWGQNDWGQASPPASVNGAAGTASAISAGGQTNCAIQAGTGAVVCWGLVGPAPDSVNGRAGTASAIAGGNYACAIQTGTDAVICWGSSGYPHEPPPPSVNGTRGRALAVVVNGASGAAIQMRECLDGLDSDGDGLADFPADPGCDAPADLSEKTPALVCDDGVDNDGDGAIDYPADPGCDSPMDPGERGPASSCDDGLDNDGDGAADFPADRGCDSPSDASENGPAFACDDGIDNDGDGLVDYPADRSCVSSTDYFERPEQCDDGIDNDHNGLVDYPLDPSCSDFNDLSEGPTPVVEIVKAGLDLGSPLALTLGDDGKIYGGNVYPYAPVYGQLGPVVYNGFQVDHGIFTAVASLPLQPELRLRGFVRGGDGAYYGVEHGDCGECSYDQFVRVTSDGARTVNPDSPFTWFFLVGGQLQSLPVTDRVAALPVLRELLAGGLRTNVALGDDGSIYGIDGRDYGLIFRMDGAGSLTTLHTFSGYSGTDGASPIAPLTLGNDGAMYGFTRYGGAINAGTVFRLDRDETFRTLYVFDWTQTNHPEQPLVIARDGALYGVAPPGTVVRVADGTVTSFPNLLPQPGSALVQGSDCALYGVGGYDRGVVYRLFEPGTLCQRIDFAPLPDHSFGDPPFTSSATSSAGLPVTFAASGSCKVSGGQVVLTGGGLCTITASQPGDENYAAAPDVSQSFNVSFSFTGFLRPVENAPALNRVHRGETVPIRFLLGGRPQGDVVADGSPTVQRIDCKTLEPVEAPEPARSVSRMFVHRRAKSTLYTSLLKTEPRWAGSCRQFTLALVDGSEHRANFAFAR